MQINLYLYGTKKITDLRGLKEKRPPFEWLKKGPVPLLIFNPSSPACCNTNPIINKA